MTIKKHQHNDQMKTVPDKRAAQAKGLGFSIVELLSSCPTNWKMAPTDALAWVKESMIPTYPLGDYKVHEDLVSKRGRRR